MFYIPIWISNLLLLVTCYLSGFQMVQLKRPNPIMNIQFMMIVFCLFLMVFSSLYNNHRIHPWVSVVLFVIAVVTMGVMIRQHRMLPPLRSFE